MDKKQGGRLSRIQNGLSIDDIVNHLYPSQFSETYNLEGIIQLLDRERLIQLEKTTTVGDKEDGLDLLRFVQILVGVLQPEPDHLIYVGIGVMELFREVSEFCKSTKIKLTDLSSYICEKISTNDSISQKISSVKVPQQKYFNPDKNRVREIDINPPKIIGQNENDIRRLDHTLKTDNMRHNNHGIKQGIYTEELNKIIVLDQLASSLTIQELNCSFVSKIVPKQEKETVVLDFAWSQRQSRLGITLKDHSLCFCEQADNFQFQKRFYLSVFLPDYQSMIWYLELNEMWVTTDKTNSLFVWDIENERLIEKYQSSQIKQGVVDLKEVVHLKLLAMASYDKNIYLWDLSQGIIVIVIPLSNGGIHSILYSYSFQVLISAGYENCVNIFSIHQALQDYDNKGKLIGHSSMVSAIQLIKNTPLIVSVDDQGSLRMWDIRSFQCLQQLNVGNKAKITKILDISCKNMLGLVGTRLNVLKFQPNQKFMENEEQLWLIRVEFDNKQNTLILCTRKEIKLINLSTGRVIVEYNGLLENPEDEIGCFRSLNQFKNFIIGDLRGKLTLYRYHNSEVVCHLKPHLNEVTQIKIDQDNNILISTGLDNRIYLQRLIKPFDLLREFTSVYEGKNISIIEVSIHHNVFFVCSNEPSVAVFDYEIGKLLSFIKLGQGNEEPTAISVVNGFQIVIISTNQGFIYIVKFLVKEQNSVFYDVIAIINLNQELKQFYEPGSIFNLTDHQVKIVYNDMFTHQQVYEFVVKSIVEVEYDAALTKCSLITATNTGRILIFEMKSIIEQFQFKFVQHTNNRINYNPYRKNKEDFSKVRHKIANEAFSILEYIRNNQLNILNANFKLQKSFQAHKENFTCLSMFEKESQYIITSAMDSELKIWNMQGELKAKLNINHPLPIRWKLPNFDRKQFKQQFSYLMKLFSQLHDVNKNVNLSLENLIPKFQRQTTYGLQDNRYEKIKFQEPIIMQQEFSPRDMKVKEIKKSYPKQISGSTLKTIDAKYKLQEMQSSWKREQVEQEQVSKILLEKEQLKQGVLEKDKDNVINFLDVNFHKNLLAEKSQLQNKNFSDVFANKLDIRLVQKKKLEAISSNRRGQRKLTRQQSQISDFSIKRQITNTQIVPSIVDLDSVGEKPTYKDNASKRARRSQDFYNYAESKNVISGATTIENSILDSSRSHLYHVSSQLSIGSTFKQKRQKMKNVLKSLESKIKQSQANAKKQPMYSYDEPIKIQQEMGSFRLPSIKRNDHIISQIQKTSSDVNSLLKLVSEDAELKLQNYRIKNTDVSLTQTYGNQDETKFSLF